MSIVSSSFTFQCDFVPVAAAAGWTGAMSGAHRRGVRSMLSRMVCGSGIWLRAIALEIRCVGGHVRVSTNRLRTLWQLVVVGCAGRQLSRVGNLVRNRSETVSSVESVCAGGLHNDAVNVAVCLARTSRLRTMHCSWLAEGGHFWKREWAERM